MGGQKKDRETVLRTCPELIDRLEPYKHFCSLFSVLCNCLCNMLPCCGLASTELVMIVVLYDRTEVATSVS